MAAVFTWNCLCGPENFCSSAKEKKITFSRPEAARLSVISQRTLSLGFFFLLLACLSGIILLFVYRCGKIFEFSVCIELPWQVYEVSTFFFWHILRRWNFISAVIVNLSRKDSRCIFTVHSLYHGDRLGTWFHVLFPTSW